MGHFHSAWTIVNTMLHSSLFLCLLLVSAITCGPAEPLAARWGGGGWGHGGSTGIIAGGVFPLPCDCLSKCYGSAVYTSATTCSCFLFWNTNCGSFQMTFGG